MMGRTGSMTERQRAEALLNREKPDRVPVWNLAFAFSGAYANASIHDVYTKPKVALAAQLLKSPAP